MSQQNLSSFIWSVADLLRGDYKQSEYGRVILPFTVLRRLDCVLAPTKEKVLEEKEKREAAGLNPEPFLLRASGQLFYNTSPMDIKKLMGDQDNIAENMFSYIDAFSSEVRDIFECFDFHTQVTRLDKANLLYLVTEKFSKINLHPKVISNAEMGLVFEELIRKFAEISNETAGEHFTPREVIRLMVNLLFIEDDDALTKPGIVRSLYDPTAGTGGMLSVADEHLTCHNKNARLVMHGQELNGESYAICKADMLIKGQDISNIIHGNTLSEDGLTGKQFDYMLSNPPFGVEWKKIQSTIQDEHKERGYDGRFGPGLPRVSDGSLLFLLHLVAKMRPTTDGGSRFGIVLNGSPLFTGGAGSGESEIRRYILENDHVEAIVGLPTDMFYNTGISTYVWIVTNRKPVHRKGKVQLIDASEMWQKMRKSLGSKRKELSDEHIAEITRLFGEAKEAKQAGTASTDAGETAYVSKVFETHEFGYRRLTIERPLRLSVQLSDERISSLEKSELVAILTKLQETLGNEQLDDYNVFEKELKKAAKALELKLPSSQIKLIAAAVTWVNPDAEPVINKVLKKEPANPIHGAFEYRGDIVEFKPDPSLRDSEEVALTVDTARGINVDAVNEAYFMKEIAPHVPDAWIDKNKTDDKDGEVGVVGYEIPFNRHFYVFKPPRELAEIDAELKGVTDQIVQMIGELS